MMRLELLEKSEEGSLQLGKAGRSQSALSCVEKLFNVFEGLAFPRAPQELWQYMRAVRTCLGQCPRCFLMGVSYLSPHIARKFFENAIQRGGWSTSSVCSVLDWDTLWTRPDEPDHWAGVVRSVNLTQLSELGCPPWHLPMYSCLLKRAFMASKALAGTCLSSEAACNLSSNIIMGAWLGQCKPLCSKAGARLSLGGSVTLRS